MILFTTVPGRVKIKIAGIGCVAVNFDKVARVKQRCDILQFLICSASVQPDK